MARPRQVDRTLVEPPPHFAQPGTLEFDFALKCRADPHTQWHSLRTAHLPLGALRTLRTLRTQWHSLRTAHLPLGALRTLCAPCVWHRWRELALAHQAEDERLAEVHRQVRRSPQEPAEVHTEVHRQVRRRSQEPAGARRTPQKPTHAHQVLSLEMISRLVL